MSCKLQRCILDLKGGGDGRARAPPPSKSPRWRLEPHALETIARRLVLLDPPARPTKQPDTDQPATLQVAPAVTRRRVKGEGVPNSRQAETPLPLGVALAQNFSGGCFEKVRTKPRSKAFIRG